ncbi:MAG: NAD(P)/FAD-dependent oxidoreductase [Pseudomonadota bacterium]
MHPRRTNTIIIGAGQAGLAMSRELTRRGIEHLLLERGLVGESWRSRPWESLRLLTPNWANGLPGMPYWGPDPHGFMSAADLIERLDSYANLVEAPVHEHTEVLHVSRGEAGFVLSTSQGPYRCRNLVLASGACTEAAIPPLAAALPRRIRQLSAGTYTRAADLPEGGVLVVGASASGVQIASEIQASGRQVILANGGHLRLPRSYRGRDIEWWLDAIGALDESIETVDDVERVRGTPSPQLSGKPDPVDLAALQARGVEIAGRLCQVRDGEVLFSGGLGHLVASADLKLARLCRRIDDWAANHLAGTSLPPAETPAPTPLPRTPRLSLDLDTGEIGTVVWATGYRPDFSWLGLPVFDARQRLRHQGGVVTPVPGLYVLGLPFLRRRRSALLSGVGGDANALARHLERRLRQSAAA